MEDDEGIEICKEFNNKSFEEILKILKERNPNVITCDLIKCSQWIYSIMRIK